MIFNRTLSLFMHSVCLWIKYTYELIIFFSLSLYWWAFDPALSFFLHLICICIMSIYALSLYYVISMYWFVLMHIMFLYFFMQGLVSVFDKIFKQINHITCLRHSYANFKNNFGGGTIIRDPKMEISKETYYQA